MEVRIKFTADVYVNGDNMSDVRNQFESMPLFSADALEDYGAEFGEILLVEDAETYHDLRNEFNNA